MTYTATYKSGRRCEIVASDKARAMLIAQEVARLYKSELVSLEPQRTGL